MRQTANKQQIRQCRFLIQATEGTASIKFSCLFFLELKTGNSKHVISSGNRCKPIEGKLAFNQQLQLVTNMIYDYKNQKYLKKEAIVMINLISNSRPNQSKLVGRVVVDLGKSANKLEYQSIKVYPLQYCSVNGTLAFRVILKEAIPTNLSIKDLQRSQLSQFESISMNTTTKTENAKPKKVDLTTILLNRVNISDDNPKGDESSFQKKLKRIKTEIGLLRNLELPEKNKEKSMVKYQSDDNFLKQNKEQQFNMQNSIGMKNTKAKANQNSHILIRDTHEIESNKCGSEETVKSELVYDKLYQTINQDKEETRILVHSSKKNEGPSVPIQNHSNNNQRQERQLSTKRVKLLLQQNKQQQIKLEKYQHDIIKQQQQIQQLNTIINTKSQQLNRILNRKDPEKIDHLKKQLLEKQVEIEEYVERIEKLQHFQVQVLEVAEIKEHNRSLTDQNWFIKNDLEQKVTRIFQLEQSLEDLKMKNGEIIKQQASEREQTIRKIKIQLDLASQQLAAEIKNHQITNLELKQVRQWYNGIQEEATRLQTENGRIKQELQIEKSKENDYQLIIQKLQEKLSIQRKRQEEYMLKQEQMAQLQNQLILKKEQIAHYIQKEVKENNSEEKQLVKKEYNELQLRFQTQTQHLQLSRKKIQQLQGFLRDLQKKSTNYATIIRKKQEQIEASQQKNADLVRRLKDKQEVITKFTRNAEQAQFKSKQMLFHVEQYKKRLKSMEDEKNFETKQVKAAQRQNRQLKGKMDRDCDNYNKQILAYKQLILNIENEKSTLIDQLNKQSEKQQIEANERINAQQQIIRQNAEKYSILHDNLNVLQLQSNRIADILQQKQEYQFQLSQAVSILYRENAELKISLLNLQNQCKIYQQRNEGLASEIQLLNTYPMSINSAQLPQFNKRIIETNRDMLRLLEEKSNQIIELTKMGNQLQDLVAQYQLSYSLFEKEKNQMEEGLQKVTEINNKLQRQLQRLKVKFQSEINANKATNQQKIQSLQAEIMQFQIKISQKQLEIEQMEMQSKEEVEKMACSLNEKNNQLEYEASQSHQLNQQIARLKENCEQKELNIEKMTDKVKQLEDKIEELTLQLINLSENKQMRKSIIYDTYDTDTVKTQQNKLNTHMMQTEILQLRSKQSLQQKQLVDLRKQIAELKQTSDEELNHINYLQFQLKSFREREAEYINRIDELEQRNLKSTRQIIGQQQMITSDSMDSIQKNEFKRHYQKQINQSQQILKKIKAETEKTKLQLIQFNNQMQQHRKENSSITPSKEANLHFSSQFSSINLQHVVDELNGLVHQRKQQEQLESALRLVIESNAKQDEQYQKWSRDKGFIQEKAKLASRQLQKIKANIMKIPNKNIAEKAQITNMLKPTQIIINELIHLSQNLAEIDLLQEQQEYYEPTYSQNKP